MHGEFRFDDGGLAGGREELAVALTERGSFVPYAGPY